MDDSGDNAGAFAAIAIINVLDHLLAPLVLEVHIDIGRLVARIRKEAREQQLLLHRIDGGDAQEIAHQ